jgi:uncharacterized membrane protein
MNRYLYRAIDLDVAAGDRSALVYSKLCRVVVIGFIEMPGPRVWKGTRISPSSGTFGDRNTTVPSGFLNFLIEKASRMAAAGEQLSERQRELIDAAVHRDPERVTNSEILRAMQQDVMMFGRAAFLGRKDGDDES